MGRKILAVVVALIVAMGVIMIVEMLNSMVVAPPTADVMNDPAKLREFIRTVPVTAYVVILIGYVLGAFAGGFIVTKMSRRESPGIVLPVLIGAILELGAILLFFVVMPGQPIWFIAASLVVMVPMSLLGHRFAR
jgi:hypothetical protein